jgi:hypothetical protein
VQFETFPATLIDRKTKTPLAVDYAVFHLLEVHPALDMHYDTIDSSEIERAELNPAKYQPHMRPFFRDEEFANIVLIHTSLKEHFDELGITGCSYRTLEEYNDSRLPVVMERLKRNT